jgi:hypothetical protein
MLRNQKQREAEAVERRLREQLENMSPLRDPDKFDRAFIEWLDALEEKQRHG